jgi:hypothetical protein
MIHRQNLPCVQFTAHTLAQQQVRVHNDAVELLLYMDHSLQLLAHALHSLRLAAAQAVLLHSGHQLVQAVALAERPAEQPAPKHTFWMLNKENFAHLGSRDRLVRNKASMTCCTQPGVRTPISSQREALKRATATRAISMQIL